MTVPRVLHIHFGKEGGAERFLVNLAKALDRRGVEQRFAIRPNRSWASEVTSLGPTVFDNYRYLSLSCFRLEWQLRRICREWQPDAILAWMPRAAGNPGLARCREAYAPWRFPAASRSLQSLRCADWQHA